ncbi:MAG TPA: response regulator transcription factor [Chloroflexia bacterium]|nr:response regulator transcription factor [Chloroflexia bacterium]
MPKILIVDDEQNILLYLSEALEDEGYSITTKSNGKDAVSAFESEEYDLVLVDLKLRDIDGLEVMREAKKHSPDTVVIMLTGHGSLESAMEAIKYGAFDYLLKPSSVQDLKESIRRGLEKRRNDIEQRRLASQAREFARAIIEGGEVASGVDNSSARPSSTTSATRPRKTADEEIVTAGDVEVDVKKHEVRRGDELLNLTPTEFNLLVTLMNNAGRVLSCKYLVKQVHNYDLSEFDSRSMIRVHIKHLRHKLERDPNNPEYILNVRGLGYKFGA